MLQIRHLSQGSKGPDAANIYWGHHLCLQYTLHSVPFHLRADRISPCGSVSTNRTFPGWPRGQWPVFQFQENWRSSVHVESDAYQMPLWIMNCCYWLPVQGLNLAVVRQFQGCTKSVLAFWKHGACSIHFAVMIHTCVQVTSAKTNSWHAPDMFQTCCATSELIFTSF